MANLRNLWITIFLFIATYNLYGQTEGDSIIYTDEIDTIRIKEKLVVNKTIYIRPEVKKDRVYLSGYAGTSTEKSYYGVCAECRDYFNKVKNATKPTVSYTYGLDFIFSPGKLYFSSGISLSYYRYKFNFTDSLSDQYTSNNKLNYMQGNISAGYWLGKNKSKLSTVLLGGISFAKLNKIAGSTLNLENPQKVVPLQEEISYYPYNFTANATIKLVYRLTRNFNAFGDLFYNYDIRTINKTSEPYTKQRNIIGLKLGVIYKLR
jgi:hypothetical protein